MEAASSAHTWIEVAALGIELLATALIICAIVAATAIYLAGLLRRVANPPAHYKQYKQRLGRALLLCLEILVAADIVRTIALDSSVQSVLSLGLLVVIRTFLSWSLILEVEGRWPWQREESEKRVDEMVDDG
ncbi:MULTISPECIES: DUF1622 domain-containing protein [Luteibacter]|jgi:uncharacterized membrane protein|uniref:DUF1622 domain-containing protein n=1 Tax=Luteibacter sp. dw_328 TaxID=2719796 RepID=UPI0007BF6C9C|nr:MULTISPECIES: DUF1622 domain-containing protein [Luteibacter]